MLFDLTIFGVITGRENIVPKTDPENFVFLAFQVAICWTISTSMTAKPTSGAR